METTALRAIALVCTLNPSPAPSSSQLLAEQTLDALREHGVTGEVIRIADHDVKPGVTVDMGEGDAWPSIREKILGADILVLSTPIWLGHPSSVAQRVMERLDGELSETDDAGRMLTYGKAAAVCVVGNEDGAHKVSADLFQGLNDVGFSIAASAVTYWVGPAMEGTDFKDLDETPDPVATATKTLAANTAHLARVLRAAPYPAK
jgi:multimeric flavodoxin WrbA